MRTVPIPPRSRVRMLTNAGVPCPTGRGARPAGPPHRFQPLAWYSTSTRGTAPAGRPAQRVTRPWCVGRLRTVLELHIQRRIAGIRQGAASAPVPRAQASPQTHSFFSPSRPDDEEGDEQEPEEPEEGTLSMVMRMDATLPEEALSDADESEEEQDEPVEEGGGDGRRVPAADRIASPRAGAEPALRRMVQRSRVDRKSVV